MKVLFDGYWWHRGPHSNRSVQRAMITTWRELFPGDDVLVLVRGHGPDDLPPGVTAFRTRLPLQALTNGVALPRLGSRLGVDLMVAHNFSPWWGTSAVFIHDLMFMDHPEWFTRKENLYFRLMPLSARRASALMTSSRAEADRITRITGDLCVPVGLGLDRSLIEVTPRRPRVAEGLSGYGLVVGRLNVRKNLARTLSAAVASGRFSREHPLIVVGESSGKEGDLPHQVTSAAEQGSVIFAGGVSNAELRWLYEGAAVFLFLSLDEGFGLPALESWLFRVPAVVSDIPVFRELLGDRATYADPMNEQAIAAAIHAALDVGRRVMDAPNVNWEPVVASMRATATRALQHSRAEGAPQ